MSTDRTYVHVSSHEYHYRATPSNDTRNHTLIHLLRTQSSHNNIQPRTLRRSISRTHKRPIPNQSKLVPPIPIVLPNTIRIAIEEVSISFLRTLLLQDSQITSEDAFELRSVAAAVWLAGFAQDAIAVGEFCNGGIGDAFSCRDVAGVVGGDGEGG